MRFLLTHGYYLFEDPAERQIMKPYPPLGLLYIASHLRSVGVDVEVLDSTFMRREEHLAAIEEARADVVGIYVNLMTRPNVLAAIDTAKSAGAKVVVGGPEPVNYAREYLDRGADVVVVGEGEETVEELLPALAEGNLESLREICGLIFKSDAGELITTPPREKIRELSGRPYPARELIDLDRYLETWKTHHGASSVSLITARGCPYTCRWCSHSVYGFSYRRRSPSDVVDEIAWIAETYSPDRLWFADDVFAMSRHWLREFADEMRNRGLKIPFETISREDRLDDEAIELLAELGCYRLWVGAESGSQRVLDAMDRRTDAVRMREVIQLLRKHGIRSGTFIMVGYPGEEWRDIDETVDHLKDALPDDVLTTLAYPIKGTPYFDEVESNLIVNESWESSSDRSFSVAGRHSRRFYGHAQKWMLGEVERARQSSDKSLLQRAVHFARTKRHRAAMFVYRNELETSP